MILGIDIGNSSIDFGVLKDKRVVKTYTIILSESKRLTSKIKSTLVTIKRNYRGVDKVVICSVVPKNQRVVESAVKNVFKKRAKVIGRDLKVPMKNNYKKKSHVGQDRLVGAFAAKELYGAPTIIIDFGTAITFDVVNQKGEYDGGIIVPGIRLSAESLFKKTALLPKISTFKVPRSVVGKTTKDSILSGLFYGYAALCNGLINDIKKKTKGNVKVIITGGHTEVMKKFIKKSIKAVEKDLVFRGIALIYQQRS